MPSIANPGPAAVDDHRAWQTAPMVRPNPRRRTLLGALAGVLLVTLAASLPVPAATDPTVATTAPPPDPATSAKSAPTGAVADTPTAASAAASSTTPPAPADKPTPAPALTVRPGGLVRWPGDDVTACIQGDERSTPVWKTCFYPVDLDAKPGPLAIARERGGTIERRTVTVGEYPYATQHVTITDQGKVDPSPQDLARIEREQAKMAGLFGGRSERRFSLPLGHPLATLPTSGRFGDRRIFNGQPRSPHTGADYAVPTGTPILAVADGTVVLAEEHFFPGKAVVIDHGDGLFTMSFHLDQITVRSGQEVRRGDRLGTVGATGRVSGPHLHFAVRWRGARIDPELLLGRESATTVE